jgi:tetratricopeptide (TPR) repeat protein
MYLLRLDADHAIDISPGDKEFIVTDDFEVPVDVNVLAVYPHAHFLANTMEGVAVLPDRTERWLIRINHWDFRWQDVYRYRAPIVLPRGTTVRMRYTYDNSAENPRNPSRPPKHVVAGPRSSDEMAHLQLQVQPQNFNDLLALKEAVYQHSLARNSRDAWAYYELGNVFRDEGRMDEAIDQYRAALRVDAAHAPSHNNVGVLLVEQGRVEEAIGHYRAALRVEPDFAEAHFNLGNALRSEGRVGEAVGHYRETLRLEPGFAEAHDNLGQALASEGKLDEAIAHFRDAVHLNPDSAEAHSNLGAGLGLQGKLDEAIVHFRLALQIDPDHVNARENLGKALVAAAHERVK